MCIAKELKECTRSLRIKLIQMRMKILGGGGGLKSTLIIAPHPDDEVLGCGGLIARLVEKGHMPHVIVMTGGEGSHRGCCKISEADIKVARRGLTRKALSILGVTEDHIHELDFPDGRISESCDAEIEKLRSLIVMLNPKTILVPHWGEGWPDHVNAAKIVKQMLVDEVEVWEYCVWMWYYNVWRGLDWKNAVAITMTPKEHQLKMKAMDAYLCLQAPCGRPWSGLLPEVFQKAHRGNRELYFKVRKLR